MTSIGCRASIPARAGGPGSGTRSRGATSRAFGLGSRGGQQNAVGQGRAHLVVPEFVAERAGHPATAGIELLDLQAVDSPECLDRSGGSDQRLLLAMAVKQAPCSEPGLSGRSGIADRSATNESTSRRHRGDEVGVGADPEVAVLVDQGQQATRLATQDRRPSSGVVDQSGHVLDGQRSAQGQEPLGDRRPTAARQARQLDPIPARLQDLAPPPGRPAGLL